MGETTNDDIPKFRIILYFCIFIFGAVIYYYWSWYYIINYCHLTIETYAICYYKIFNRTFMNFDGLD